MTFQDIIAAIAVVINGLPQGLLSLSYGFGAFPTAIGFIVGSAGFLLAKQVAPISFQAEAIVLAGQMGEDRNERLNIVFFTGVMMSIIGALGLLEPTINFIGPAILNSMMAGVGITLAKVSVGMFKSNKVVTALSMSTALLTYFITDKNLVYTIVTSVFISSIAWIFINKDKESNSKVDLSNEKFKLLNFKITPSLVRKVLALTTMQIGGNIAYSSVTGSLANTTVNVDHVTLYSGLADATSALFGGGPVEAVISGTAVAPNPVSSGLIMMLLMAVILLIKLLPKIAKYVPSESIAGFLFVLGAIVVFPSNIATGVSSDPMVAGVTTIVTASTDPFIGMISGIIVRFLTNIF